MILVSILASVIVVGWQLREARHSQEQQNKAEKESQTWQDGANFRLQAAKVVMSERTPEEAVARARLLVLLFPKRIPQDFATKLDRFYCLGKFATIVGTKSDNVIPGTPGDDVIVGLDGDDTIWADQGDDRVCGGAGNDQLFGEWGNDFLLGGSGSDAIEGGPGSDRLGGNERLSPP